MGVTEEIEKRVSENKEIPLDEYEVQEQVVAEAEEAKPEVKVDLNVLSGVVATLTSMDLPEDLKQQYIQQYTSLVPSLLQLVGFDQALSVYSLQQIPPWLSMLLGFVIIAGGVVLLKPKPKSETKEIAFKEIEKPKTEGTGIEGL